MKEYAISIIIPVYNGEQYLKKCLNSIISQTIFKKLQVVVVNDGSTDNSLHILEDYTKQYTNIEVVSILNSGVSHARNVGIEKAVGEYVTFVDSDDWVDCECYEKMYKKAKESAADIVAAGFFVSNNRKDILKKCVTDQEIKKTQSDMLYDYLIGKIDVHCCDKIFLRKSIETIRFNTDLKIAEDRLFLYDALLSAQTIYLMSDAFYHYYQNANSVMHDEHVELNMDGVNVAQKILDKTTIKFPDLKPYAEAMYISMVCRVYCEMDVKKYKNDKNYKKLSDDIKQYTLMKGIRYMSVKHLIAFLITRVSPRFFIKLRKNTFIRFIK